MKCFISQTFVLFDKERDLLGYQLDTMSMTHTLPNSLNKSYNAPVQLGMALRQYTGIIGHMCGRAVIILLSRVDTSACRAHALAVAAKQQQLHSLPVGRCGPALASWFPFSLGRFLLVYVFIV